jgi:hypothetical protein
MDSACHVTGCQLSQEPRIYNVFDDVASTIHQLLPRVEIRARRRRRILVELAVRLPLGTNG